MKERKSMEPWLKDEIQFYDHQIDGIRQMIQMRNFLLADDMGLGKSLQALTVASADVFRGWATKIIVIAPVTLKSNWFDEFEKFTRIPATILGQKIDPKNPERLKPMTPAERETQLDEFAQRTDVRALIVNYEQVPKHLTDLNRIGFDIAIFDEAHYLKNNKAKRTQACHKVRARRYFMLTGTPMLNQVNELWGILHLIDRAGFPKYWSFVNRYCNTPDAPIWMYDGSFKEIGKIQVGDVVMGWEPVNGRKSKVPSTVLEVQSRTAPQIIEVTMESGQIIRCTPDHQWLREHGNSYGPIIPDLSGDKRVKGIQCLSKVITPTQPLPPELQPHFEWLMGLWDGEGSNDYIAQSKKHNPKIHARIGMVLTLLGIPYREDDMGYQVKGGVQTFTNLLNWSNIYIKRDYFLKRIRMGNHRRTGIAGQMNRTSDRIANIKWLGSGEVVSMQTTSGNYIAWGYASKNCVFGGYKDKQIIGMKNEKELTDRLHNIMIRRLKKDVLDLPEVQIIPRKIDLSEAQRKLYDKVVDELEIEVAGISDPQEIDNALTKLLRLKQICGTTLPFTGKDDSAKLDLAVEDAIEIMSNGHKIVVFTQFRSVQEAFINRLEEHGKKNSSEDFDIWELNGDIPQHDRQPIVKEWATNSKPGVIVCMLQVAGVGLNMTAAQHAMFLDKLWVPGLNQQAIDRLHRIGQQNTQPVQVYEYLCKGTVETRVEQVLKTKSKLFGQVVNDSDFKQKLLAALANKDAA